ncbi:UNVERIFIED_CONTAM: hypothetical protein PYX00_007619 [Menopon gallinae]|uniref:Ig-like domain-containing protein n=1 Tax=Menopon gallinae TaxID=328185 RepID=A0AAW2HKQ9_9NEOP
MTCLFDLENQKLYSVKWYKNDLEFYRFMPNNYPQMQIFQVEGVHLDTQKCNMTAVTLHPLEFATSGLYACEISTEAPHFKTVQTASVMTVIGKSQKSANFPSFSHDLTSRERRHSSDPPPPTPRPPLPFSD